MLRIITKINKDGKRSLREASTRFVYDGWVLERFRFYAFRVALIGGEKSPPNIWRVQLKY